MTLNDLCREFAVNYMTPRLRPSTVRGYLVNLNNHTLPLLGDLDVQALTVEHLDKLTATLRPRLSGKSIVYVHATLRKVLSYAVRRGYLAESPYRLFDMPKIERFRYVTLTEADMHKALAACKGTRLEVPVTLALCYGLRRGECLGILPAKDLDAARNTLHVQRTRGAEHGKTVVTPCKTDNGNRLILLTPQHTAMLSALPQDSYACPLSPYALDTAFRVFLKQNGLPPIRFHDLRHTYATFMLQKGVNPKIVSTVLGHSSVSVTLDIYSHPDVRMQAACLAAWET